MVEAQIIGVNGRKPFRLMRLREAQSLRRRSASANYWVVVPISVNQFIRDQRTPLSFLSSNRGCKATLTHSCCQWKRQKTNNYPQCSGALWELFAVKGFTGDIAISGPMTSDLVFQIA